MKFLKYHALGNDYIVLAPSEVPNGLLPETIHRICHRNYGIGSDGILLGPLDSASCDFGLQIFNPDGSEAEKSGNGLRIFARTLWDRHMVSTQPFTVETLGGAVSCTVLDSGKRVTVEMGQVRFNSAEIPVTGSDREVLNEQIQVLNRDFRFCAATVGNPHCVILSDNPSPGETKKFGPLIETDARFPNRINVQFMKVLDRNNIQIEIWERGAGYTLASGSSSTAAAGVALKLGLCDPDITVHMPGGEIQVHFKDDFSAIMTGPVTRVCKGVISEEIFYT
ncbi:MAG: diaminopimelate epimerase [Deltaproteobacteria bacterium]|nr:diaminopimelate epimerase [Deltaproteobacteria bacterium]